MHVSMGSIDVPRTVTAHTVGNSPGTNEVLASRSRHAWVGLVLFATVRHPHSKPFVTVLRRTDERGGTRYCCLIQTVLQPSRGRPPGSLCALKNNRYEFRKILDYQQFPA